MNTPQTMSSGQGILKTQYSGKPLDLALQKRIAMLKEAKMQPTLLKNASTDIPIK